MCITRIQQQAGRQLSLPDDMPAATDHGFRQAKADMAARVGAGSRMVSGMRSSQPNRYQWRRRGRDWAGGQAVAAAAWQKSHALHHSPLPWCLLLLPLYAPLPHLSAALRSPYSSYRHCIRHLRFMRLPRHAFRNITCWRLLGSLCCGFALSATGLVPLPSASFAGLWLNRAL